MTQHIFLDRNNDPETTRRLIESITPERREQILQHCIRGVDVRAAKSVPEALELAGANFTVEKRPLMAVVDKDTALPVPGKVSAIRVENGVPTAALGVVGTDYGVLQNTDAFAGLEYLVQQGQAELFGCWQEKGGARVGLTALLGATVLQRGTSANTLAHLACVETSHDMSRSTLGCLQTINLVCLNGMTSFEMSRRVHIRHTSRAEERMAEAMELLLELREGALVESQLYNELEHQKMGRKEFRTFCETLLNEVQKTIAKDAPGEEEELKRWERDMARRERKIEELTGLFTSGQGNSGKTRFDAYNAITEWLSPRRERFEDARRHAQTLTSNQEGHGARVRQRALRLLTRRA